MANKIERFNGTPPEPLPTLVRDAYPVPKDRSRAVQTAPTPFYKALLQAKPVNTLEEPV